MTLQQHANAACRSCSVLETSITNSIFPSSVGSSGEATLSRRVEGWKYMLWYGALHPWGRREVSGKAGISSFFWKISWLVTLHIFIFVASKFQGIFISAHLRNMSFKAFLCSSLRSLSSSTLQCVMVTQSFLQKVSTFCYLPRSKDQEEFILLCLVVQKERLEMAAALCRLLVGWRGKMQEKMSPADGEMRTGILYLWVFLAIALQWVTQKGKAGVGVKATGRGW